MPPLTPYPSLWLLRPLAYLLALGGRRGRLSVLGYHRVLEQPDPLCPDEVDVKTFRWQMELLARCFKVLPLLQAVQQLRQGRLPARAVCVTFDDGYADNVEVALPVLKEVGVPATFFIATGYLDGGRMWNDTVIEAVRRMPADWLDLSRQGLGRYALKTFAERRAAAQQLLQRLKYLPPAERQERADYLASLAAAPLPTDLMMSARQVQALHAAGMEVGAHTAGHPILARLDPAAARREIAESKERLEGLIGGPVRCFAYPNGKPGQDYLPEHVHMVRDLEFAAAVSTQWGVATAATDPWQLPRFTPWDRTPARFMARLLWNCYQAK